MVLPGRWMSWKTFLRALWAEWVRDDLGDVAAALTFSMMLAMFPFLLFLVSLASVLIDPQQATALVDELSRVAPPQVTQIIGGRIQELGRANDVGILTFGAITAIWVASGGLAALMRALNKAYGVTERRPFWKTRLIAITITLFTAVIVILAAIIAVALPPLATRIGGPLETALLWLRLPVAALLMMFVWAVLYYALPDVEQRFRFITPGSVVGVVIWATASWGFSVYVRNFGRYEAVYGALGGLIILLLWMWVSSQAVLLGAEINAILEHRSPEGKRVGARAMAESGADLTKSARHDEQQEALERRAAGAGPRRAPGPGPFATALAALLVIVLRRRRT